MSAWRWTRLKHLASGAIRNGVGEPGAFDNPEWPRYVRTTDIAGPRQLREDTFASLPPNIAARADLQRGDLVMTAAGATIGKSLLYDSEAPACYAGYLVRFRPRADVDIRFVSYWTESRPYWEQLDAGRVVSTIENFNASKYRNLRIRVPATNEQRAIADYLDAETARIDALISKKRRMLELLAERRRAFAIAFTTGEGCGDDWTPGPYWLSPVPRTWQPYKIAWHKRTASGTTPDSGNSSYYDDTMGVPWVTTSELRETTIRDAARRVTSAALQRYSALKVLPVGAVLIAMYGATVGRLGVLGTSATTNQACCAVYGAGALDQRFLYWWFWANREHLISMAYGAGQPNISQDLIRSLRIPAPEIGEQREIADRIEHEAARIERIASKLTRLIDLLTERRQTLITAVLTSEMAVPGVTA